MTRVGVTGHQRLGSVADWQWVEMEMERILTGAERPLEGITSLAIGADQMFAEAVVRNGGHLIVVLPFKEYERTFTEAGDKQRFRSLIKRAVSIVVLESKGSEEESYLAAGKRVVDESEWMIAVWDGEPAAGLGGTADVVQYAVSQRKPVLHIN